MKNKIIIVIMLIMIILEAGVIAVLLYERNNIIQDRDYLANSYNTLKQNNDNKSDEKEEKNANENNSNGSEQNNTNKSDKNKITDWNLILVNHENTLPENFDVKLSAIDNIRKFDSRAIKELNQMMLDMKAQKVTGVWIQSSYRSIEAQQEVFNNQVQEYMNERKNKKRSRRTNT